MAMNINIILEPMSMPIFTEVLGWSPDALGSLLAEVRKEIADVKMHAYMTLYAAFPSPRVVVLPIYECLREIDLPFTPRNPVENPRQVHL